jgi:hypothetical protein
VLVTLNFSGSVTTYRRTAGLTGVFPAAFELLSARYFPSELEDKRIGWQMEHPGYDLYFPKSAAAHLGISQSFFRESVKNDPEAPVIMGHGVIA